jgi:hypothetical protein
MLYSNNLGRHPPDNVSFQISKFKLLQSREKVDIGKPVTKAGLILTPGLELE